MNWISVNSGLPKEGDFEVLVNVNEPFFGVIIQKQIVGYYEHEIKEWRCDLTSRKIHNVTHWMPLPESPTDKPIERGAGDDYPVIEPQNWK